MLKLCCPVMFDLRLHELEKEWQEEIARHRARCEHGIILNLNSRVPQQFQSRVVGT
jgi:hypothetical protein